MTMGFDDEDGEGLSDEMREQMRKAQEQFDTESTLMMARWEDSDLDSKLRRMGVYVDRVHVQPVPTPKGMTSVLVVIAKVNRVAFSTRVLDPEAAEIDKQFGVMEVNAVDDDFVNTQIQIRRNIAAGRDPFDDGEG